MTLLISRCHSARAARVQTGWGFNVEDYSGRVDKTDNGKVSGSLAWPGDGAEVTRGLTPGAFFCSHIHPFLQEVTRWL